MKIEITGISLENEVVEMDCINIGYEKLDKMIQDEVEDDFEDYVKIIIDTKKSEDFRYLRNLLKRNKRTEGSKTYGEALHSILGTMINVNGKYAVWE